MTGQFVVIIPFFLFEANPTICYTFLRCTSDATIAKSKILPLILLRVPCRVIPCNVGVAMFMKAEHSSKRTTSPCCIPLLKGVSETQIANSSWYHNGIPCGFNIIVLVDAICPDRARDLRWSPRWSPTRTRWWWWWRVGWLHWHWAMKQLLLRRWKLTCAHVMTNACTQVCIEGSIPFFWFGHLTKSRHHSQSWIVCILNYHHMTDIDCLYIKLHTLVLDCPNISVIIGVTSSNVMMRIDVLCLPTYSWRFFA